MATVINNPDSGGTRESSGMGLIIGVIVAVIIVFLFIVYGLPGIRGRSTGGTNVNVPDKINVDVNKTQ
jgi:hypothetical protein